MIDIKVQQFISKNRDLLNSDLEKFLRKANSFLRQDWFEQLIELLRKSNINIEPILDAIIINRLNFVFTYFLSGMPLVDLVDELFDQGRTETFFGKTKTELVNFIMDNDILWEDQMYLEVNSFGRTIVRKC